MSNLSATGALTAFGSGIMLGFGWALLNNDRFQDAKDVAHTTIAMTWPMSMPPVLTSPAQ